MLIWRKCIRTCYQQLLMSFCHAESGRLPFSRDVIVLTIHGADSDLTLIDLPGLIQSHEQNEMVQMVEDLVVDYIK
jgi:hypothetical protein